LSRVTDLKQSVLAALVALPGLSGVDVVPSRSVRAPFRAFGRKRGVYLIYGGFTASESSVQYAGVPKKRKIRDSWAAVVMAESYRSAAEAFEKSGGADELLDGVLGIQGVNVAPTGWGAPYLLETTGGDLTEPDEGLTDQGGTVGYIVRFTSSEYVIPRPV
jgi:hypothetical protein